MLRSQTCLDISTDNKSLVFLWFDLKQNSIQQMTGQVIVVFYSHSWKNFEWLQHYICMQMVAVWEIFLERITVVPTLCVEWTHKCADYLQAIWKNEVRVESFFVFSVSFRVKNCESEGGRTDSPLCPTCHSSRTHLPACLFKSWEQYQKQKVDQKSKDIKRSLAATTEM